MKIDLVKIVPHTLNFKFEAGTSRGTLTEHNIWYLILESNGKRGIGEIAPLKGLSIDYGVDFKDIISKIDFNNINIESVEDVFTQIQQLELSQYPALVFGLETAFLDLFYGGKRKIFDADFYNKEFEIPINGLIWMSSKENMLEQIRSKIIDGYKCLKLKISQENWKDELDVLKYIRQEHDSEKMMLRVDANGAFNFEEAKEVIKALALLEVHSIEQPIAAGQLDQMKELIKISKIGIALDEELIGVSTKEDKIKLLDELEPHFLILKPTLLGGFHACDEWIELAIEREIDFWVTSALESNIGLNAICQYVEFNEIEGFQGLGTGQLYHNNIESPLTIDNGHIYYDKEKDWRFL